MLQGTVISATRCSIVASASFVKYPLSMKMFLKMNFEVPRKRLGMGSIMVNLMIST